LDISPAIKNRTGIGRLTHELLKALSSIGSEAEFVGFYNRSSRVNNYNLPTTLPTITTRLSDKMLRTLVLLANAVGISQDTLLPGIDIFHATDNLLPNLIYTKSVFTLYDLSFLSYPKTHTTLNRLFLKIMMPYFLRKTDAIIAISNHTRKEALRFYNLNFANIKVIYPGVSSNFQPITNREQLVAVRQRYCLPERFFLYVGTIEPRKNLATLFEAFKHVHHKGVNLVIVGKKGWRYKETVERLKILELTEEVLFTDFVADDILPAIYSLADACVYPSLYEGFGFPVLEAMACGTPVISSNTSSLPEVTGESAILLDPRNIQEWVRALGAIIRKPKLREKLKYQGLEQAKKFGWETAARETMKLYQEIYDNRN